eukprot:TRINITY_DN7101_c0_g1_i1.p1 TRINITY_DN7101_c0_g1~~TRINITY_DN7101_c0_g1_i1.p1  ORF type:complete len:294 (+),score=42.46 TRINITY_DN7101_c0_g1_i1:78-959(+)
MSMPASSLYAPLDVSNDTVLITGATAGIGWATALRFGELGCSLVLVGRRTHKLEELRSELQSRFPTQKPVLISLDVSDAAAVKDLPTVLEREHGVTAVDILVNNAGLALGVSAADEVSMEDVQTMLQTNVAGVIGMTTAFVPGMRARGKGHLVNISSVAGHECYQGGSVYTATKHAVNAYTTCARHDLAGTPIRVTAISPGMVETEFSVVRFGGDQSKADKVYDGIVPLCPDDIADQIVFATTRPRRVQVADIISYATNQAHAKYVVERKGVAGLGPGGEDWREAKKSRSDDA